MNAFQWIQRVTLVLLLLSVPAHCTEPTVPAAAAIGKVLEDVHTLQPDGVPDYRTNINGWVNDRVGLINAVILAHYDSAFLQNFNNRAFLKLHDEISSHTVMMAFVKFLLLNHADPNLRDKHPFCPDISGQRFNPPTELLAYLQCGARGLTPLHLASIVLDGQLVNLLMQHDARPDVQLFSSRFTPMHSALQMVLVTHLHQTLMRLVSASREMFRRDGTIVADIDSTAFTDLGVDLQIGPLQNLLQMLKSATDHERNLTSSTLTSATQLCLQPPFPSIVTDDVQKGLRTRSTGLVIAMLGDGLQEHMDLDTKDYVG